MGELRNTPQSPASLRAAQHPAPGGGSEALSRPNRGGREGGTWGCQVVAPTPPRPRSCHILASKPLSPHTPALGCVLQNGA